MLWHDFLTNDERLINKWVHYLPIYERFFDRFRNRSVVFWEIGVFRGGSLQMWKRYFGPFATIVGIDIEPKCASFEEDQIKIRIGDQSDTGFLQSVIDEFGPPDVVLDDGSHMQSHVRATFDFMYDKVNNNGVYMVEDLHCSYRDAWEGGLNREGTFIEQCKGLLDSLNARESGLPRDFADKTWSMSFFDSVAVFEKMKWLPESFKSIRTAGKAAAPKSLAAGQARLAKEAQEVRDAIGRLEAGQKKLARRCGDLAAENAALKNSSSWKITAPLRRAARFLRGSQKKGGAKIEG